MGLRGKCLLLQASCPAKAGASLGNGPGSPGQGTRCVKEGTLAYSLNDLYQPLRNVMRINGAVVGLLLGLALLLLPRAVLSDWGIPLAGETWPLRSTGALLLTYGLHAWLAAREPIITLASLVHLLVTNGLLALVLLVAYLQGELAGLHLMGRLLLIVIFALCLAGTLAPLPYLRREQRA